MEAEIWVKVEPITNETKPESHLDTNLEVHIKKEPIDDGTVYTTIEGSVEPEASHYDEADTSFQSSASCAKEVVCYSPQNEEDPLLISEMRHDGDAELDSDSQYIDLSPLSKCKATYLEHSSDSQGYDGAADSKGDINSEHGVNIEIQKDSAKRIPRKIRIRKKYVCDVCTRCFSAKSLYTQHYTVHTGEKPHLCSTCNKSFKQRSHLWVHLKTHTGEKPYVCNICNKQFTKKWHLDGHLKIHTGEQPYECNACHQRFTHKVQLRRHTKIHTGEELHVCEVCNKCLTQKSDLLRHMRTHTGERPHVCEICKKSFTQKGSLKKHLILHSNEKPFLCEICNERFRINAEFLKHVRTHNGEKLHDCNICQKSFINKNNLKRHIKIHHSGPNV